MRGLMVGEEIDKNQATVSCPKCGTSNTPSANFCSNCSFAFNVGSDHPIISKYLLGDINKCTQVDPKDLNIGYSFYPKAGWKVDIDDPYLNLIDKDTLDRIQSFEKDLEHFAKERRINRSWTRESGSVYIDENGDSFDKKNNEWGDPVSHQLMLDFIDSPSANAWFTKIPSSLALEYISDPIQKNSITDNEGNTILLDKNTRDWLIVNKDAIAIRNRAKVLAELVVEYISTKPNKDNGSFKSWMSVGSGTALPTMQSAKYNNIEPDIYLVDISREAMNNVERLASEIGFTGNIHKIVKNILNPVSMTKLRDKLDETFSRPELIDAMGIFEYVGEHVGNSDPVVFLRSIYDMLLPGGRLIFGQMRSDRPNPDLTFGAVGWPYIVMRDPEEVLKIIDKSDIDLKTVKVYLPNDGVYGVYSIDKPEEH